MSIDAIEWGIRMEERVERVFRVRCDNNSGGFIEVSKTPPTGANAMTVTIKPLYGEAFTVNADLLRSAVELALHHHRQSADDWFAHENWRRKQIERLAEGQRVKVADRGRCDYPRMGTVTKRDESYAEIVLDRQHPEEEERFLRRKLSLHENDDILAVYDAEDEPAVA